MNIAKKKAGNIYYTSFEESLITIVNEMTATISQEILISNQVHDFPTRAIQYGVESCIKDFRKASFQTGLTPFRSIAKLSS